MENETLVVGPVLSREMVTAPRRLRLFFARAGYVAALVMLMATAWLILSGTQNVRTLSDLARFGSILFQILATLQLVLVVLFSALFAASAVAQEKDRRTLILLLLTDLTNSQLVLGKLLASLLIVLVVLAAAVPLFLFVVLLGSVSFDQVARAFAVTLASALAAGSLGSTVALWREKTFQALAMTALVLVFWFAFWEVVGSGMLAGQWFGISAQTWAAWCSPWRAILVASQPVVEDFSTQRLVSPNIAAFLTVSIIVTVLLNLVAIVRVRVWNPSRQIHSQPPSAEPARPKIEDKDGDSTAIALATSQITPATSCSEQIIRTRRVWNNPILWREICTWAYGRKVLLVRLVYIAFFVATALVVHQVVTADVLFGPRRGMLPPAALPLAPLLLLSMVLINALAVTSLTTERDGQALDLLLATDLTPKEIVFGKLGGILYNTKEMIILPLLLCFYVWHQGHLSGENLLYTLLGVLVMDLFVATLGIHAGMTYVSSRSAIGVSVGTVLFLFVGVATCMRIMVAFIDSFEMQLAPFVAVMLGGGVGLYMALGYRNPSTAIGLASLAAPPMTFYALTSFLMGNPLAVILTTGFTYGFATAAMLVPAITEFDVAIGRTTAADE